MKCPSCDTANPDNNRFCMQCGKPLKDDKQTPVALPTESVSPLEEVAVSDGKKSVNTPDRIDDVDERTIVADAGTNVKESAPTNSDDAVPLSEAVQVKEPATSDIQKEQEDPSSITNEPTMLAQPVSIPEESHPIEEESSPDVTPQPPNSYKGPPVYPGTPSYPGYPVPEGRYPSAPSYPGYPPAQPPNVPQPGISGQYPPINVPQPGMSGQYPPVNIPQSSVSGQYPPINVPQPGMSERYQPINENPPMPASFANQTTGPTIPSYPSYPSAMAQPQAAQQPAFLRQMANIAKPLPVWILIVCTIVTLVILVVLQLTGNDWADGAMRAAIGAISIAVLLLLFAGIRIFLGMLNQTNKRRVAQLVGSALAVVLLFIYSGLALIGQNPLHTAQAQSLEGQQHWQDAINEYQLGGEAVPSSTNIARVYDEWGEALSKSGNYTDAISKFDETINNYTAADVNAITRAQRGEAIAYYNLAQSELSALQYDKAVTDFKTLQSRFPNSPEAQKVHGLLATALLGKGKQDRANVCSSAIPTYQDLEKNYPDTPEGQSAANELKQPQPVKGHFTSSVSADGPLNAELVQNFNGTLTPDQAFAIIDSSPATPINGDGTFMFQSIKQGKYGLVWTINHPDGSRDVRWYYLKSDPAKSPSDIADVGPLCPFDFGNITHAL